MAKTSPGSSGEFDPIRSSSDHPAIELCCLIWAHPDHPERATEYEDEVLALLADYGGEVVTRAIGPGLDDMPHETQIIRLPDQRALDAFLGDPRRRVLRDTRDEAIARMIVYPVRVTGNE